jgi:hypothetical protein
VGLAAGNVACPLDLGCLVVGLAAGNVACPLDLGCLVVGLAAERGRQKEGCHRDGMVAGLGCLAVSRSDKRGSHQQEWWCRGLGHYRRQ